jgi:hypothetical protein
MSRFLFAILSLITILPLSLLYPGGAWADDSPTVAGRTVDQYAAELNAQDRVVVLRAAKSLGAFGAVAGETLRESLDHQDAAVRYIAAEHLGRIGGKPLETSIERLCELAADESSLAVRLAASFALCRNGLTDDHLPLLIETLDYPERGMACSAAALIGMIGPQAAAAIGPLETVYEKNRPGAKGGDYHVGGAAMNALRKVRASHK